MQTHLFQKFLLIDTQTNYQWHSQNVSPKHSKCASIAALPNLTPLPEQRKQQDARVADTQKPIRQRVPTEKAKTEITGYIDVLQMRSTRMEGSEVHKQMMKSLSTMIRNSGMKPKAKLNLKVDPEIMEFKQGRPEGIEEQSSPKILGSPHDQNPSPSDKNPSTMNWEDQTMKASRVKGSIKMDQWQLWYQEKHKEKIQSLRNSLKCFIERIGELQKIWRNHERVNKFLKKHLSPAVQRIILSKNGFISQNINILLKQFQYRETVMVRDRNLYVTRFHFIYQSEFDKVNELVEDILHSAKLKELNTVQEEIQKQLFEVKSLEKQITFNRRITFPQQFQEKQLSYYDPYVHSQVRDEQMKRVERLYGQLSMPSGHVREINEQIKSVLNNLYQR